jgi:hypothetical protein
VPIKCPRSLSALEDAVVEYDGKTATHVPRAYAIEEPLPKSITEAMTTLTALVQAQTDTLTNQSHVVATLECLQYATVPTF